MVHGLVASLLDERSRYLLHTLQEMVKHWVHGLVASLLGERRQYH